MSANLLKKFVGFAGVGAIATAIQYVILIALTELAGASPVLASAIGYAISAVLNYLMKYHFVFASTNRHLSAAPKYALISTIGLLLNTGLMRFGQFLLGSDNFESYYLAVQVLTTGLVLVWNFSANLIWTFRHSGEPDENGVPPDSPDSAR